MIARLLPTQVSSLWSLIRPAIVEHGVALCPGNWDLANEVFKRCLSGLYQVWIFGEGTTNEYKGCIITEITNNNMLKERVLNINLFHAFQSPSEELVSVGREALLKYAKAEQCDKIAFHTRRGELEMLLERWWPANWEQHSYYTLKLTPAVKEIIQ